MSLLDVFFKPRKIIREAFGKPSAGMIVGLNLIAPIISFLLLFLLGFGFHALGFTYSVINTFMVSILFAIVAYILVSLAAGKSAIQGRFFGLLQAASLAQVINVLISLVAGLNHFVLFTVFPGIVVPLKEGLKGIITFEELVARLSGAVEAESLFFIQSIFLVITFLIFLYWLVFWFIVVEEAGKTRRLKSIITYIAVLIVLYAIMSLKDLLLWF